MNIEKMFVFCCKKNEEIERFKRNDVCFISIDCIGTLGEEDIFKVIEKGYTNIIVLGCKRGRCKNKIGNILGEKRVNEVKKYILEAGLEDIKITYIYGKMHE